jgi:hypothetical protein
MIPFTAENYGRGVINPIQRLYDEQAFFPLMPFQSQGQLPVMGIAFIGARNTSPLTASQLVYRTDQLQVITISRIPSGMLPGAPHQQRHRRWWLNLIEQSFARNAATGDLMPKGRARQWRADARPLQDIPVLRERKFVVTEELPERPLKSRFDGDFRCVTHLAHNESDRPVFVDAVVRVNHEDHLLYRWHAADADKLEAAPEGRVLRGATLVTLKQSMSYGEANFHPDGAPKRVMTNGAILPVDRQPEMVTLTTFMLARMCGVAKKAAPANFLSWAPLRMAEYNVSAAEAGAFLVANGLLETDVETPLRQALLAMAASGQIAELGLSDDVTERLFGKTFALWYDFVDAVGDALGPMLQAFLSRCVIKPGEAGYDGNGFLADARFLTPSLLAKANKMAWCRFPSAEAFVSLHVPGRETRYAVCDTCCATSPCVASRCAVCGGNLVRSPMTVPAFVGVLNHAKWNESPLGDTPWQFNVDGLRYDFTPRYEVGRDLGVSFRMPKAATAEAPAEKAAEESPAVPADIGGVVIA